MNELSKVHQESSSQQKPVGDFVVPTETTPETPKLHDTYDKADLDEYCLWLYSIYERLDIESNKRT